MPLSELVIKLVCHIITTVISFVDYILGLRIRVEDAPPISSVEVGGPTTPGEGPVRRSPDMVGVDLDAYGQSSGRTMVEMLNITVDKFRHRLAFGYRPIVATKTMGKGKMMTTLTVMGRCKVLTYGGFHEKVMAMAAALLRLGLQIGDTIALYEETCVDWLIIAHAAWQSNMAITTVYANLGEDALHYAMSQTKAKVLFTNAKHVQMVTQVPDLTSLVATIYRGQLDTPVEAPGIKIQSIEEMMVFGEKHPVQLRHPDPDDIACIMYTSGTTGDPKGVLLSHRNMVAAIVGMLQRMDIGDELAKVTTLQFLPLAHIYSLVITHCALAGGSLLAIGQPSTLTDNFAQPHGDLTEFRPGIICAVPRVFDIFKKAIEAQLAQKSTFERAMFQAAYDARKRALSQGHDTPLWNLLVFRKLRKIFGGRLQVLFSGGAPLNGKTQEFIRVVLGATMEQGYGLTETTACLAVQYKNDLSVGNVGAVHGSCEVKLVDIPDMGYTSTDKPHPRGEIWVRGPIVSKGYFNLPEMTDEVFHDGGWFATGDVGQWLPNGALQLIDRKKNLVKLAMGEYVALEKLESVYSSIKFALPNGICCIANPERNFPVALISVNKDAILITARINHWKGTVDDLLKDPKLLYAVQEALDKEAESNHLKPFEQIKRFCLLTDVWTPENGMLTAAMKLQRRKIEEYYKAEIAALYS